MTIGKGMGGGFPVSGLVSTPEITSATPFSKPSSSSSSYGGNPLAATAALATIQTIVRDKLVEHTAKVGALMLDGLRGLQEKYEFIGDVRGKGLLIGLDLVKDRETKEELSSQVTERIFQEALKRGLLMMGYFPRVRLNPPLVITAAQVQEGIDILDEVFQCIADEVDYRLYRGAIVGCGAVACQAHVPAWRTASAFRMVAAVDPIPAQRAHLQTLLPEVRCYADLETLLAHEELDFLDVCTPPALHEEGILQACAHGLHVLCEKPLTFTAPAMQRIRRRRPPPMSWSFRCITGSMPRLSRRLNGSHGWRGRHPLCSRTHYVTHQTCGDDGVAFRSPDGWRWDFVGPWLARFLPTPLPPGRTPRTIAATLERRLFLSAGVEDTVTCDVTFPQAQAHIHLTWAASQRRNLIVVRGPHGEIRLDDARLVVMQHGHVAQELDFPQALSAGSYHPEWFAAMLPDFQAELEAEAQRGHNVREAETCLRLTLLAYRSAAQNAQPLACTQALDCAVA